MAITTVAQSDDFDTWRTTLNTTVTRWNALGTSSAIVITGGSINNTAIGASTPSTAVFTNCTVSSTIDIRGASILLDNNSISGDAISGGTATFNYVELNNAPTATNHATTKTYVDTGLTTTENNALALAIALG